MTDLYATALEVHQLCEGQGWSFCIIGGVAVQRWGEVRLTKDVDLTVFTGFIGEEGFINVFLSKYNFRPPGTRAMAISSRVLLLENDREIPIDVALRQGADDGRPIVAIDPDCAVSQAFMASAKALL